LERAYIRELPTAHYNEHIEVIFVEYGRSYTAWHNSNHELIDWLEQLGCSIDGWESLADFEVDGARLIKKPPGATTPPQPKDIPQELAEAKVKVPVKRMAKAQVAQPAEDPSFWPISYDVDAVVPR